MDVAAETLTPDEERRRRDDMRVRKAYRRLFATTDGETVLTDILTFACAGRPSFVVDADGRGDPMGTAYHEGMRRVALRIAGMLNVSDAEILRRSMERSLNDDEVEDEG